MMKIKDVSMDDIRGALTQMEGFISQELGYDSDVKAEFSFRADGCCDILVKGSDEFQRDTPYSREVGKLFSVENAALTDDWATFTGLVWDRLSTCMRRDERELRHSLQMMSAVVEDGSSYTSAIGKMIADRIKAVRDETNGMFIEFRQQPAE